MEKTAQSIEIALFLILGKMSALLQMNYKKMLCDVYKYDIIKKKC